MSSEPGAGLTEEQFRKIVREETEDTSEVKPQEPDPSMLENFLSDKSHRPKTEQCKRDTWNYFLEWFDQSQYQYLSDLATSEVREFKTWLSSNTEISKYPLRKNLERLKTVIDWASLRDYVDDDKIAWTEVYPDVSKEERRRDEDDTLLPERGQEITAWVENERFSARSHVIWILVWKLGLRKSACLALDRSDFHDEYVDCDCGRRAEIEAPHFRLRSRPEIGLPLKKRGDSEPDTRFLPLGTDDAHVIRQYLFKNPTESREPDEHGNYGLLLSQRSPRLGGSGFYRAVCYLTSPATYEGNCTCRYCRNRDDSFTKKDAEKCELSRSPHGVRHGAITRMFDRLNEDDDLTVDGISYMVGTDPTTLKKIYDQDTPARQYQRHADDLRRMM